MYSYNLLLSTMNLQVEEKGPLTRDLGGTCKGATEGYRDDVRYVWGVIL